MGTKINELVTLMRGFWIGDGWSKHLTEVGILSALLVIGVIISAKTFRWE